MSLNMTASVPNNEICIGQSLPVSVTLANKGSDPIDVIAPLSDSPFTFELRPEDPSQPRRAYSQQAATFTRDPDYRPQPIRNTIPLKTGQSQTYIEDIAAYMLQPIAPGKYSLLVTQRDGLQAPPIPLTFVALKPILDAATPSPSSGSYCHLAVHQTTDGSTLLFHKESIPDNPADGIWHNRFSAPADNPITSAAIAIELASNNGYRWYAFLQKDHLAGAVADSEISVSIPPQPLNLQSPTLHPIGWQRTNELADFIALGVNPQKQVTFTLITLKAPAAATISQTPVKPSSLPKLWTIVCKTPGADYDLIWTEAADNSTRVYRQSIHPAKQLADSPLLLAERPAPAVALATPAITPPGAPACIDLLTGPFGEEHLMTLERLRLDGKDPLNHWTFPAPVDDAKKPPTLWVLAPAAHPDPPILAKLGNKLLVARAAQPKTWTTLVNQATAIGLPRLELLGTVFWASWTSDNGMNYQAVRSQ